MRDTYITVQYAYIIHANVDPSASRFHEIRSIRVESECTEWQGGGGINLYSNRYFGRTSVLLSIIVSACI